MQTTLNSGNFHPHVKVISWLSEGSQGHKLCRHYTVICGACIIYLLFTQQAYNTTQLNQTFLLCSAVSSTFFSTANLTPGTAENKLLSPSKVDNTLTVTVAYLQQHVLTLTLLALHPPKPI